VGLPVALGQRAAFIAGDIDNHRVIVAAGRRSIVGLEAGDIDEGVLAAFLVGDIDGILVERV
jgi:hypothetical protein